MSNEPALWRAVIAQAISDATTTYMGGVSPKQMPLLHARARRWLTIPNRDFASVCAMAGVEPDTVRAFACQQIAAYDERR
ncbi:hypothetical protein ACWFZ6_24290 [Methylorubrum extorquens]